ncbi:hypothetical protein F3Y22_tig00110840pilonHSYRG00102 [Hibiscus syriacus]|uniref:Uncharacterized protein n=1 Tax=Hibiscus syriacus TaxID=106335 RepID=A0A6A2ZL86_HIBSY|nr:hypothetical protein F3Y22_tig00110840pilonHSYRG00102 [Hibiscus syriacus]
MEIPVINKISDFEDAISSLYHGDAIGVPFQIPDTSPARGRHGDGWGTCHGGGVRLNGVGDVSPRAGDVSGTAGDFHMRPLIFIIRPHHSLPSETLLYDTDFDIDSDIDSSSDDESEYEEPSTSHNRYFSSGKSVVKLWENLTLEFDFEVDESDDVNKGTNIASIFGGEHGFQAISAPFSLPSVVISAGVSLSSRRVPVGAWDTRLCRRVPAIVAGWRPKQSQEKIAGVDVDDGVEKVYTRGDVTGTLTVGDMRMVLPSSRNLTTYEGDILVGC